MLCSQAIVSRSYQKRVNIKIRNILRSSARRLLKTATYVPYVFSNTGGKTPILVYHRVCPLHFKKDIVYANVYPEEFERQMLYLKRNFDVVTVSEYLDRRSGGLLNGSEICITFDDGFRDNYVYAFPVLKKNGLKAAFFIVTKYIGGNDLFGWMPMDGAARQDSISNRERWRPLSWEEVREMMEYGMEFGTHTHTHRASLAEMDPEEARGEIEKSTAVFRQKTGTDSRLFSYPHGTSKDYNSHHVLILKSLDYRAALTTTIGRNGPRQNQFELKRIIVYEDDSLLEFKKKVNGAYDMAAPLQRVWLKVAGTNADDVRIPEN